MTALLVVLGACTKNGATAPATATPADPSLRPEAEKLVVYPEPPPPGEPNPIQFPGLQKFVIDKNGLTVYVVENHEVPLVDVRLIVKAGEVDHELLAGLTAGLLAEGTQKHSKAQFDALIEQVGSSIWSHADTHNSVIGTRVLSRDLPLGLSLVGEMVQLPLLGEESLSKLKDQRKAGLRQQKSSGDSLGQRLFGMLAYPAGHPYARPFPSEAQIDAVTVAEIRQFQETYYRANNAYLVLSGDVTPAQARRLAAKHLGKWTHAETGKLPASPLEAFGADAFQGALPTKMVVHVVDRKSVSTDVLVGNLAITRSDPNWPKLEVLHRVLGSGASSRLFKDIREQRKLTYNVNTFLVPAQSVGAFFVATQTKKVDEMLSALFEHRDRIRKDAPSEVEHRDAVRGLVQALPLEIETAQQVAARVTTLLTYHLPEDYWKSYPEALQKVGAADVQDAARKYVHDFPIVVLVGKASKIRKQLRNVPRLADAEVVVYDTELRRAGAPGSSAE